MEKVTLIVVKVGGSLFDWPELRPALRTWLGRFPSEAVLLIAGGGHSAEAVRTYDRIHNLGEEISHWLAIESLAVTTSILESFVDGLTNVSVLNVIDFCETDDALPHSWAVTSDSIAARVAEVRRASRLILLKSVDVPDGTTWPEMSGAGIVDDYFPTAILRLTCPVEIVNLRAVSGKSPSVLN